MNRIISQVLTGYTTAVKNLKKIQGKNRLSPAAQNVKKIPE
jgi:hypothetical protein